MRQKNLKVIIFLLFGFMEKKKPQGKEEKEK